MQISNSALLGGRNGRQGLPAFIRRPLNGLLGLGVFAALALAVLALATWNVADPSFSLATGNPPTNALGFPGAAFADLVMQFFGIGSVVGLLAGRLLGRVSRSQQLRRPQAAPRQLAWFAGAVLASAVLACLPVPSTWPLPSGLGGVFGDMVLKLPALVLGGYPHGAVAAIIGAVLVGAGRGLPAVRGRPHRAHQRKRLVADGRSTTRTGRRATRRRTRTTAPWPSGWSRTGG